MPKNPHLPKLPKYMEAMMKEAYKRNKILNALCDNDGMIIFDPVSRVTTVHPHQSLLRNAYSNLKNVLELILEENTFEDSILVAKG